MRGTFSFARRSNYFALPTAALLLGIACSPQDEPQDVWQLEEAYWQYVEQKDAYSYDSLWHQDFVGWQCEEPRPGGRANIGDWVRALRDEDVTVSYELRREAVQQFGNVAVVHYGVTWAFHYPDGRVEGEGAWQKVFHTWMKTGDQWLIIGGMCGPLEESD